MNDFIIRAVFYSGLVVIFAGCVLLLTLAVYGVMKIWAKFSAFGKNMKEYYWNRRDFMEYKMDFYRWEERKRRRVDTCKRCEYRMKYLKED